MPLRFHTEVYKTGHCEERSDEAICQYFIREDGRNDILTPVLPSPHLDSRLRGNDNACGVVLCHSLNSAKSAVFPAKAGIHTPNFKTYTGIAGQSTRQQFQLLETTNES